MGHTLSGSVNAPRSLNASLNLRFSPLLSAILMVIGVSGDGDGLMVAMMARVLSRVDDEDSVNLEPDGVPPLHGDG